MSVFYGTMTSKGQTTLPAEIRELLHLKPGDKISYFVDGDKVVIKAKNKRAVDLIGILQDPERPALSVEEMDEAIGEYLGDKHKPTVDDRDRHKHSSQDDAG